MQLPVEWLNLFFDSMIDLETVLLTTGVCSRREGYHDKQIVTTVVATFPLFCGGYPRVSSGLSPTSQFGQYTWYNIYIYMCVYIYMHIFLYIQISGEYCHL